MAEIIQHESAGVLPPRLTAEAKRQVRSQAMRHFRREQKKQRDDASKKHKKLLPGPPEATQAESSEKNDSSQAPHEAEDQPQEQALVRSNVASSSDDTGQQQQDIRILPNPAGAAFHRYMLAEKFGAHLIGSEARNPRSAGILCYRGYVTNVESELVQSIDDALCLALPGCALKDSTILNACRKRHLAAVENMRKSLQAGSYDIDSVFAFALTVIFVDVFEPCSIGFRGLYEGAVRLFHTHSEHLMSSKMPATIFLLLQFRHIVLLESLANRSPLAIQIETWKPLPMESDLCSVMHETLMQLAVQLPALLQSAREVRSCFATNSRAFTQAFGDLLKLERQLTQWQREHCKGLPGDGSSNFPVPSEVPSQAVANVGTEDPGNTQNAKFLTAHAQAMCCICLLLLQESLADLLAIKDDNFSKNEFVRRATATADTLCNLAEYFIHRGEGLLHNALAIRAPLHFAREWYATNGNSKKIAWIYEKEAKVKKDAPFLSWEALLPLSLVCFYMHG